MAANDILSLRLKKRERELLLKYGYPFEELQHQLERAAEEHGVLTISIERDDAGRLIADLVYSAKQLTDRRLLEELDALMTKIENRLRFHGVW